MFFVNILYSFLEYYNSLEMSILLHFFRIVFSTEGVSLILSIIRTIAVIAVPMVLYFLGNIKEKREKEASNILLQPALSATIQDGKIAIVNLGKKLAYLVGYKEDNIKKLLMENERELIPFSDEKRKLYIPYNPTLFLVDGSSSKDKNFINLSILIYSEDQFNEKYTTKISYDVVGSLHGDFSQEDEITKKLKSSYPYRVKVKSVRVNYTRKEDWSIG